MATFQEWMDKEGLCYGTHSPADVGESDHAKCSDCRAIFHVSKLAVGSLGKSIPRHKAEHQKMTTHIEYISQAASPITMTRRAERIARGSPSCGVGSGSRMRRFVCDCTPPVIVRTARDTFDATCHHCTGGFHS